MSHLRIAAIVEGNGEVSAVPILVRRVAAELDPTLEVEINPVLRVSSSRLRRVGELERNVELAARKLEEPGGIFILLDCDWENGCPAQDGPELLSRAKQARPDKNISLVLAKMEFEAWFIAAAESLRGKRGLHDNLQPAMHPEDIRGAKEWLSRHMPQSRPYTATTDQPALTAVFDLLEARRADSFDKCYRELRALLLSLDK
jgi:hypothetical protein